MYKITWDKETGGVLLHSRIVDGTLGVSPRPVFYEELDLLGLDELGWIYPHSEAPIMWAVNKQYWYRGVRLFDAKGADIYTRPTLEMQSGIKPMSLEPVDVKEMLKRTSDLMTSVSGLIMSTKTKSLRLSDKLYTHLERQNDYLR